MPIRTRITTRGFEEYLERIARAGNGIDAAADEALRAGGAVLVEGMKERAPKDTHKLENSIGMDGPKSDGNFHFVEVGVISNDANVNRYGAVQEYGSAHTTAKAYIRGTLDTMMGQARAAMRAVFKKWLGEL